MNTDHLFRVINNISILSAGLQEQLRAYLIEEQFKKKHLLLKEGMVAQRIYFIKKGLARAFHYKNGEKFTTSCGFDTDKELRLLDMLKFKDGIKTESSL